MVRWCYLCNRKASKADNISLHRFPRNLDLRAQWLNACGLTANDDVTTSVICSRHFVPEDICQSTTFGGIKSLIRRYAVPKLLVRNPPNTEKNNESPLNTPLMEIFSENEVANESSSFSLDINITDHNYSCKNVESPQEHELTNIEDQMPNDDSRDTVDPDENYNSNQCIRGTLTYITDSNSGGENTVPGENNSPSDSEKRKFFEPRHVGELSPSDFSTPKKANRIIKLIKKTDEERRKKIKKLQRRARDLEKRVESLQDLINHLQENHMSTEESEDTLMV